MDKEGNALWTREELDRLFNADGTVKDIWKNIIAQDDKIACREDCAEPIIYVETYHVDTELALYVFLEKVRGLSLGQSPA